MNILRGTITPIACALAFTATTSMAQEYFRDFGSSKTSSGSFRLTPGVEVFSGNSPDGLSPISPALDSSADDNYNFRLGNFDFTVAMGLGIEANDNIALASDHRVSDIIFRPELDIEGILRISETNRIRLGIGIGYAKYMSHSEFDSKGVLIAPNSAFTWTAKSGSFTFTFRERLSYQEDPFEIPVISNAASYRRWENQAGVQVDWEANEYTRVAIGYDRFDLRASDAVFKSQDRAINTIYVRPSYQLSPYLTVGLNASSSWINYRQNIQSDGRTYLVGPYAQWKVNDTTDVYVEVGLQKTDFDNASLRQFIDPQTGAITARPARDESGTSSYYAKVEVTNRPTEYFRHKLTASKTAELGLGSNFYDLYHFEYTADWKIKENTSLTPGAFYEYYETSGDASEHASRYGVSLGFHHIFSEHLTIGLDYRFLKKDSNLSGSDYYQNLGMASLYYKF